MTWFNVGKSKSKWEDVLPMLFPFELNLDLPDSEPRPDAIVAEKNKVSSLPGPIGLRVYLMDNNDGGIAKFVNAGHLKQWEISLQDLYHESVLNLEKKILPNTSLKVRVENGVEQFRYVDNAGAYTASLILTDRLWTDYKIEANRAAVAIPHRTELSFTLAKTKGDLQTLVELCRPYFDDEDIPQKHLLFNGALVRSEKSGQSWTPVEFN